MPTDGNDICLWGYSGSRRYTVKPTRLIQRRPAPSADAGPVLDAPYATP